MKKENGVLLDVTDKDLALLKTNPFQFWEGEVCHAKFNINHRFKKN